LQRRKPYEVELAELDLSFDDVVRWAGIEPLRNLLMEVAGGPALFVGTGGTFAAARLAAILHERIGGQPGRAVTPLELATLPPRTRSGVVLFSAGLSHPDALAALDRFTDSRLRPAVVVTLRDAADVAGLVSDDVRYVVLPPLGFREGFLATTSVLIMTTALIRGYLGDEALPESLPRPTIEPPDLNERLLVLTTPGLSPVAIDIETRCHELGLAAVQVTDYRNFAHGRHVGLLRGVARTSVLALVDQTLKRLATATIEALPKEIAVTTWEASQEGPAAVIELLVASMEWTAKVAARQGVNPARPGAAPFGRKLYHLRLSRLLPPIPDGPVERKLDALVASRDAAATRAQYEDAFRAWFHDFSERRFGGLVLDYDGTVCSTGRRFELPNTDLQVRLSRLLDDGVRLGFASGRGPSLHRDLREWIPRRHWEHVITGMYNGGVCVALAEDLDDLSVPSPEMTAVVGRLQKMSIVDALHIEPRMMQVTVSLRSGAYRRLGRLNGVIAAAMAEPPALDVKVVGSGHSIDIVPRTSSKVLVINRISASGGRMTAAIGDQGDVGGNDFDLLASQPWTLTVDRCSADPSRCWYLDAGGRSGPDLLGAYLDAMRTTDGEFSIQWRETREV